MHVLHEYEHIHSIELSDHWYNYSKYEYGNISKISLHHGDSKTILPELLKSINEPVTVFLDAHWSGGLTAFGEVETPLLFELEALYQRKYDDIIIIDDSRMFGNKNLSGFHKDEEYSEIYPLIEYDWTDITLDKVRKFFKKDYILLENYKQTYTDGAFDQLILIKNNSIISNYENIEFLDINSNNIKDLNLDDKDLEIIKLKKENKKLTVALDSYIYMYNYYEDIIISLQDRRDKLKEENFDYISHFEALSKYLRRGENPQVDYQRGKVTLKVPGRFFSTTYSYTGPVNLSKLSYYLDFSAFGLKLSGDDDSDWTSFTESSISDIDGEIPEVLKSYYNSDNISNNNISNNNNWSSELIDIGIQHAMDRTDISPPNYEFTALDLYTAFTLFPLNNKKVLVSSNTIFPWIECIVLSFNEVEVTSSVTSDDITTNSNKIKIIKNSEILLQNQLYFDVIISFSLVEHDGLGRIGTKAIDPFGDFSAMKS